MKKYPCPKTGKEDVYPRCTTIIDDCTNKGGALTQWAANMTVQYIKEQAYYNEDKDEFTLYSDILNASRFNFREVSQKALDIGSEVHNLIEKHLKNQSTLNIPISIEADRAFNAFLNWKDKNKLKPIQIEQKVYGDRWAGTLDFYGYFNDKLYVIDWKSSKAHYPEMRYQIAAYRSAVKIDDGHYHSHGMKGHKKHKQIDGCGVLRLDKETGLPDFKDHSKTFEQDIKIFNRMVDLYYERHPRIRKQFKEATK